MVHIPRPNIQLFPSIRELVRELPPGSTIYDLHAELETLGCTIFDLDIPAEIQEIMREKIGAFTSAIREYKIEEKEKEREAARAEIAAVFERLTHRDEQARTALLIAVDPLCVRCGDERISLRGELAPQFGSIPGAEITESLLQFGPREKIVQIAKGLRHDLLKIKNPGLSISLKRLDNFIQKFNAPELVEGEKGAEENGFSSSEIEQSV